MPKLIFTPENTPVSCEPSTKVLACAIRAKIKIRYGCASCRCGTCGVLVSQGADALSPMKQDERDLLNRMALPLDGSVRLACQARILGEEATIDLDFQNQYSPDQAED